MHITLEGLLKKDKDQFIKNCQIAFQKVYQEEFGDIDEMILPAQDVENALDDKNSIAYRILKDGNWVGGIVLTINKTTKHNSLDLVFINHEMQEKGIGSNVWSLIENMYRETIIWETFTPYYEKRNIHFYVNKCGFSIIEFFNPHHPDSNSPQLTVGALEYSFRFQKVMSNT